MLSTDTRSMLLVDDDRELIAALREEVAPLGIDVEIAMNGQDALAIMATRRFDAVLSDLRMPLMNGFALLVAMRDRGIETPFVMLTGTYDPETVRQALRLGVLDFIQKPAVDDEIVTVMQRAVEIGVQLKKQERELDDIEAELAAPMAERLKRVRKRSRAASLWRLLNDSKRVA